MIALEGQVGSTITIDHTTYHYFAGNNYLGLANHPRLINAAVEATRRFGINFSAARQTTGTATIHTELEKALANFKQQEAAMVFASGYLGNKLIMEYLCQEGIVVLLDSMAHSSIRDAIPRQLTLIEQYGHLNMEELEQLLNKHAARPKLIATDGLFALTGEICPLDQLFALAEKYDAQLLVDDAHATGVLGQSGKGTAEHFQLHGEQRIYQSETMSKALGSYGGFITGSQHMIDTIRQQSAFYGASTSLPPALVAAGIASMQLLEASPEQGSQLCTRALAIKQKLQQLGLRTIETASPIIPVILDSKAEAEALSSYLYTKQIIAPAVNYPVKTEHAIVRITLSTAHTESQINALVDALAQWRK